MITSHGRRLIHSLGRRRHLRHFVHKVELLFPPSGPFFPVRVPVDTLSHILALCPKIHSIESRSIPAGDSFDALADVLATLEHGSLKSLTLATLSGHRFCDSRALLKTLKAQPNFQELLLDGVLPFPWPHKVSRGTIALPRLRRLTLELSEATAQVHASAESPLLLPSPFSTFKPLPAFLILSTSQPSYT